MIARRRHQLQAPRISTVTAPKIKLPGTVGPTAPCRTLVGRVTSDDARLAEALAVPLGLPF